MRSEGDMGDPRPRSRFDEIALWERRAMAWARLMTMAMTRSEDDGDGR